MEIAWPAVVAASASVLAAGGSSLRGPSARKRRPSGLPISDGSCSAASVPCWRWCASPVPKAARAPRSPDDGLPAVGGPACREDGCDLVALESPSGGCFALGGGTVALAPAATTSAPACRQQTSKAYPATARATCPAYVPPSLGLPPAVIWPGPRARPGRGVSTVRTSMTPSPATAGSTEAADGGQRAGISIRRCSTTYLSTLCGDQELGATLHGASRTCSQRGPKIPYKVVPSACATFGRPIPWYTTSSTAARPTPHAQGPPGPPNGEQYADAV